MSKKIKLAITLYCCLFAFQLIELAKEPKNITPDVHTTTSQPMIIPVVKLYGNMEMYNLWNQAQKKYPLNGVDVYGIYFTYKPSTPDKSQVMLATVTGMEDV